MLKRKNKKGFTLAELLIVVAIIAVLVAIAVPLFVGALNKAEEATQNANIRAVRGTAVAAILMDKDGDLMTDDTKEDGWYVTAKVSKTGEIDIETIKAYTEGEDTCTKDATNGGYTVNVHVTVDDLDDIGLS